MNKPGLDVPVFRLLIKLFFTKKDYFNKKHPNILRFNQTQNSTNFLLPREKITRSKELPNRAIDLYLIISGKHLVFS